MWKAWGPSFFAPAGRIYWAGTDYATSFLVSAPWPAQACTDEQPLTLPAQRWGDAANCACSHRLLLR